jgi:hypothetical protein
VRENIICQNNYYRHFTGIVCFAKIVTMLQVLEELFRTQMNNKDLAKTADFTAPDLHSVR